MSSGNGPPRDADDLGMAETVHPALTDGTEGTDDTALGSTDTLQHAADTLDSSEQLGKRPDADKLIRAVARAKIAGQLFQKKEQVKLGRYHLLEMIGAGGMGVVWGAWDPELDRLVAIKLVKAEMQGVRDRILLEGQALAKVSHPNIVPVFDVGVVDEQVYLVMEWVRGKNLRAYCKTPRAVREILAIYRSAAEGLIAAHDAGIIHRDFKPDNAILGDDGRVRILDFGLARGEVRAERTDPRTPSAPGERSFSTPSSDLTRGAGTPRYMPPEQAEGRALTPAVDQYAFCVSLREALVERSGDDKPADVPKWIDEILTRGTAREASNRYPSMAELLRALSHDPATVRRNRLLVVGGVAVAATTFAVGMFAGGSDSAIERCGGGKDEIARSWNAAVRDQMAAHLRSLGPYGVSEATRLVGTLDEYTAKWAVAHREACLTKERGELTAQLYERNLSCLARTRVAMSTAIDVLTRTSVERLPDAVTATAHLPHAERCLTETQTSTIEPPPAPIAERVGQLMDEAEKLKVLAFSLDDRVREETQQLVVDAEQLAYQPLIARAQLVRGLALKRFDKATDAIVALEAASRAGFRANDLTTAIEAYALQIHAVGSVGADDAPETATKMGAIAFVEAIAQGLGASAIYARALLYNNIGTVYMIRGDRPAAREWFRRAIAETEALPGGDAELSIVWGNLALVVDTKAEQAVAMRRGREELARFFGPKHPTVLELKLISGMLADDPRQASSLVEDACAGQLELHASAEKVGQCAFEVGWLAHERGDLPTARKWFERTTSGFEGGLARGFLLLMEGKSGEAAAEMQRIGTELASKDHFFPRFRAVDAWLVLGLAQSEPMEKAIALQRAHDLLITLKPIENNSFFQRRLARIRGMLARVINDRDHAREYARLAIAWYRDATGYDVLIDELSKI